MPHYGHLLRILSRSISQTITNALNQMDLTSAQGHIMGFLAMQKTPACPRDVEEYFHMSHATVSGLLARLEKKGFIELLPDENDRRCKRIHILQRGHDCSSRMYQTILSCEAQMVQDFSEEEKALFADLLSRAIDSMGGETHIVCKEESHT